MEHKKHNFVNTYNFLNVSANFVKLVYLNALLWPNNCYRLLKTDTLLACDDWPMITLVVFCLNLVMRNITDYLYSLSRDDS